MVRVVTFGWSILCCLRQELNLSTQLLRFIIVGILNTIIGLSVIYLCIYLGFNNYLSNIIGYMVGLSISFVLSKYYVFNTQNNNQIFYKQFIKFILIFIIAYSINIIVLFIALNYMTSYTAQFIAMVAYTVINFILNKYVTFRDRLYE